MAKNTLTPKKKQLTKKKINLNGLNTCGGKSGDIPNVTWNSDKTRVMLQVIAKGLFVLMCFYFFFNIDSVFLIIGSVKSEIIDIFDGVLDWCVKLSNYRSRARLQNIYYTPITTDRPIISDKILEVITNQTYTSIELLTCYIESSFINMSSCVYANHCAVSLVKITNTFLLLSFLAILVVLAISIHSVKVVVCLPILLAYSTIHLSINNNFEIIVDINNIFEYTNWLIEETFRLRNVYIDSNYFLTNDATKGIERFTDLVVPWYVDNGDVESWGMWSTMVEQVDQIREREKYFIMNDLNNISTPKKRLNINDDGSLFTMLNKPIKRIDSLIDILLDVGDARSKIYGALENRITINNLSVTDSKIIASSIWGDKAVSPTRHRVVAVNGISDIMSSERNISLTNETSDMLDFILPQKNNIVSDSIQSSGSLSDRKQIVLRNNSINSVDGTPLKATNRRPDTTKATNYIFEKTLQNERTKEYSKKTYLTNYIKWGLDKFTVSGSDILTVPVNKPPKPSVKPIQYNRIDRALLTKSSVNDLFLDRLSKHFVDNKRNYLGRYADNTYYAYASTGNNSFNSSTSMNQNNYSMLLPDLSKNGLLRLGLHNYVSPRLDKMSNMMYNENQINSSQRTSFDKTNNNSLSSYFPSPNSWERTESGGDALLVLPTSYSSTNIIADNLYYINDLTPAGQIIEPIEFSNSFNCWQYIVDLLSLFYVIDVITTSEFNVSEVYTDKNKPIGESTKFLMFDPVGRSFLIKKKFDHVALEFHNQKKYISPISLLIKKNPLCFSQTNFLFSRKFLLETDNIQQNINDVVISSNNSTYLPLFTFSTFYRLNDYIVNVVLNSYTRVLSVVKYLKVYSLLNKNPINVVLSSLSNTEKFFTVYGVTILWHQLGCYSKYNNLLLGNFEIELPYSGKLSRYIIPIISILNVSEHYTLLSVLTTKIKYYDILIKFVNSGVYTGSTSVVLEKLKLSSVFRYNLNLMYFSSVLVQNSPHSDDFLSLDKFICLTRYSNLLYNKYIIAANNHWNLLANTDYWCVNNIRLVNKNIKPYLDFNRFYRCTYNVRLAKIKFYSSDAIRNFVNSYTNTKYFLMQPFKPISHNRSIYKMSTNPLLHSHESYVKLREMLISYKNIDRTGLSYTINRKINQFTSIKNNFVTEQTSTLLNNSHTRKTNLSFYSWNSRNRSNNTALSKLNTTLVPCVADKYFSYLVSSVTYDSLNRVNTQFCEGIKQKRSSFEKNLQDSSTYTSTNNTVYQNNLNTLRTVRKSTAPLVSVFEIPQLNKLPSPITPVIGNYLLFISRWATNSELFVLDLHTVKNKIVGQIYKIICIISDRFAKEKIVDNTNKKSLTSSYGHSQKLSLTFDNNNVLPFNVQQNSIEINYFNDINEISAYNSELTTNQVVYVRTNNLLFNLLNHLKKWLTTLETALHYSLQGKLTVMNYDFRSSNWVSTQSCDFIKYIFVYITKNVFVFFDKYSIEIQYNLNRVNIVIYNFYIDIIYSLSNIFYYSLNIVVHLLVDPNVELLLKYDNAVFYSTGLRPVFYCSRKCYPQSPLSTKSFITTHYIRGFFDNSWYPLYYYLISYNYRYTIGLVGLFSDISFQIKLGSIISFFFQLGKTYISILLEQSSLILNIYLGCSEHPVRYWNTSFWIMVLDSFKPKKVSVVLNYLVHLIPPFKKLETMLSEVITYIYFFNISIDLRKIYFWLLNDLVSRKTNFFDIGLISFDSLIEIWDSKLYTMASKQIDTLSTEYILDSSLTKTLNNTIRRSLMSEIFKNYYDKSDYFSNRRNITVEILFHEFNSYLYNNLTSEFESLVESKLKLVWLNVCIIFDFVAELTTEIDFEPFTNPLDNLYSNFLETVNEYIAGDEMSEERDILGLSVNLQIGDDPGNEMTTLNDMLDIPNDIETFFGLDSVDLVHEVFGLDSPDLGEISPSFDLTIPVKSLWLVGVFYYNPVTGGIISVDLDALWDFFKVIYLDSRISNLATIYDMVDLRQINTSQPITLLFRLRIYYLIEDLVQLLDLIYIKPSDYISFAFLYMVFLFNYFGGSFPILAMLSLLLLSKLATMTESNGRSLGKNDFTLVKIFSWAINYSLYRFIFHLLANLFIFIRMTIATLVILTGVYLLSEGFHIFSVLRIIDSDQENLKYYSGQFFTLERDPFIEKHSAVDEVWDEFKYDSSIDTNWSSVHFERDTTEILGGNTRELGNTIEMTGFAKKFDYPEIFELDDDDDFSSRGLSTTIDQIHNRISDDSSYITKFHTDTELEREFLREFERVGPYVPGSTEWYNRANEFSISIAESSVYDDITSSILNESSDESVEELDGRRYDLLLFNTLDPVWLYNESIILSQRQFKPDTLTNNGVSLSASVTDFDTTTLEYYRHLMSTNRVNSLLQRNAGSLRLNPIQDMWDLDVSTDWGLELDDQSFTSYGSVSNNIDNWIDAFSDPVTQVTVKSHNPAITDTISLSHVNNLVTSDNDMYTTEKIVLEKSIDLLRRVRLPYFETTPIHTITGNERSSWKYYGESLNYLDEEDTTYLEKVDKNDISSRYSSDLSYDDEDDYEYYIDWLFWDISNKTKKSFFRFVTPNNKIEFSLGSLRNRLFDYSKFEGDSFLGTFKDNILKENKKQDTSYLIENSLNKYSVFNSNAFYSLSEEAPKSPTFGVFRDSVITQKVAEMDVDAESRNKSQFFKNDPLSEDNTELTPSGDTDDSSSEMWGAFENYYENGIRTSTSNETISFSDYSYRFKKKDYGVVYKSLTRLIGEKNDEKKSNRNTVKTSDTLPVKYTDITDINKKTVANNNNGSNMSAPPVDGSDYAIIGDKIFRDKINYEIVKSFSEQYNILSLGASISNYKRFLTGELLKKYQTFKTNDAVSPPIYDTVDLPMSLIRKNFDKKNDKFIESVIIKNIIYNNIPKSRSTDHRSASNSETSKSDIANITDVIERHKSRKMIGNENTYTKNLNNLSKKLDIDLSNYSFSNITSRAGLLAGRTNKNILNIDRSKNINHSETVILASQPVDIKYPSTISEKLSDYVNTYLLSESNNPNNLGQKSSQEEITNSHILNTVVEDSFGFDNKMRLAFTAGDSGENEVRLPRVLSTLQDTIDGDESKKFLTNYKKKKVNEFSENYTWDSIDPDDSVEDAEEGDLESHSSPTWTHQYVTDYSQNPLFSSPDDSNMYSVTSQSPVHYLAYNNLDFLAMGSINLITDAEQESFRNISNAWVGGPNIPRSSKRSSMRQILDSSNYPRDTTIESPETQRGKKESVGASNSTDEGSSIVENLKIDHIGGFTLTQGERSEDNSAFHLSEFLGEILRISPTANTFTEPWGININRNYKWSGTVPWDMADNLQEFGDMFSDAKYRVYNPESKVIGLTKPVGLTLGDYKNSDNLPNTIIESNGSINYIDRLRPNSDAEMVVVPYNISTSSREANDNLIFFNSKSNLSSGIKYANNFLINDSSVLESKKYSPRKIISNTVKLSEYEEPALDDGDQAWLLDSEVNQNWLVNTKFDSGAVQYNFISSSIEQKVIEQEYYSKFMPRNSSVLTSREANNLLWKIKKRNKRINIGAIMRSAQEPDDDESVQQVDYFKNDWHSLISSPTSVYVQDPNYFTSETDDGDGESSYGADDVDNSWAISTINFLISSAENSITSTPIADLIDDYSNLSEYNNRKIATNKSNKPRNLNRDKRGERVGSDDFTEVLEALSDSLSVSKVIRQGNSSTASASIHDYMSNSLLHAEDEDDFSPDNLTEDLVLSRSVYNTLSQNKLKKPLFIDNYAPTAVTFPYRTQNALLDLYQIEDYTSDESNDITEDTDVVDSGEDDEERYPSFEHTSRLINTPFIPNENIDDVFDSGYDSFDDYDSYLAQIDNVADIAPDSDFDSSNSDLFSGSKDSATFDDDEMSDYNSETVDNITAIDEDTDPDDGEDDEDYSNFDIIDTELGSEDDSGEYDDYLSSESLDSTLSSVGAVAQDPTDITEDAFESGGSGGSDGFIGAGADSTMVDELQYYIPSDYESDSSYHPNYTNSSSRIKYDFNPSPYDESLDANTEQEFEIEVSENIADNFDMEYIEYDRRSLRVDSAELESQDLEYIVSNYLDNSAEEIANLIPNNTIAYQDTDQTKHNYGTLLTPRFSINEEHVEYDDGVDVDASSDEYLRIDLGTETAYSIAQADSDVTTNSISDHYEADILDDIQGVDDDSHDKELLLEFEMDLDEFDTDWETRGVSAISDDNSIETTDYDTNVFDEFDDSTESTQDVDLEVSTPVDYSEMLADNSAKLRSQITIVDGDVDDTNSSDDSVYISDESDIGSYSDGGTWVLPLEDYYPAQSTDWNFLINTPNNKKQTKINPFIKNKSHKLNFILLNSDINDMVLDQQQNSVSTALYGVDRFFSDIQFDGEEGEHRSNLLTANASSDLSNYRPKNHRPTIQPNSQIMTWRKELIESEGWGSSSQDEYFIESNDDTREPISTGEHYLNNESKIIEDVLLISHKKPGFFNTFNFNGVAIEPEAHDYVIRWDGNGRHKEYAVDILPETRFKKNHHLGRLSSLSAEFDVKYKLVAETKNTTNGSPSSITSIKPLAVDSLFSRIEQDDSSDNVELSDLIASIAIPTVRGLKIRRFDTEDSNDPVSDYDLGTNNNILKHVDTEVNQTRSKNYRFLRTRRRLNRLLTNSITHKIRTKNERAYNNGIRFFSYNENLVPSPFIRSLSIDSNLFNKINSLRVYGSGRLQDYLYSPKLSPILLSSDYLDINDEVVSTWGGDYDELDDDDEDAEESELTTDEEVESFDENWDVFDDTAAQADDVDDDSYLDDVNIDIIDDLNNKSLSSFRIDRLHSNETHQSGVLFTGGNTNTFDNQLIEVDRSGDIDGDDDFVTIDKTITEFSTQPVNTTHHLDEDRFGNHQSLPNSISVASRYFESMLSEDSQKDINSSIFGLESIDYLSGFNNIGRRGLRNSWYSDDDLSYGEDSSNLQPGSIQDIRSDYDELEVDLDDNEYDLDHGSIQIDENSNPTDQDDLETKYASDAEEESDDDLDEPEYDWESDDDNDLEDDSDFAGTGESDPELFPLTETKDQWLINLFENLIFDDEKSAQFVDKFHKDKLQKLDNTLISSFLAATQLEDVSFTANEASMESISRGLASGNIFESIITFSPDEAYNILGDYSGESSLSAQSTDDQAELWYGSLDEEYSESDTPKLGSDLDGDGSDMVDLQDDSDDPSQPENELEDSESWDATSYDDEEEKLEGDPGGLDNLFQFDRDILARQMLIDQDWPSWGSVGGYTIFSENESWLNHDKFYGRIGDIHARGNVAPSRLLRTNNTKLIQVDPILSNLTPNELKEMRSKNYDYLKDYLLELRTSEANYIVGDDDDDGDIDNEIEDNNSMAYISNLEIFEDEVNESDFLNNSIGQDTFDTESAVDLLSDYFSSKITLKLDFESLRGEVDNGEVINEETGLLLRKQQSILTGFQQSEYKKNLFQRLDYKPDLSTSYCSDENILVSQKSTSERTTDSFILPKNSLNNNVTTPDYYNAASLARRTNEDSFAILPRIKWGSLKKLYLYQFNNNDRYISSLVSSKKKDENKQNDKKQTIPPLAQYVFDSGFYLDKNNPGIDKDKVHTNSVSNLLINNKLSSSTSWNGLENGWNAGTKASISPIKILKSATINFDINRTESHMDIPQSANNIPVLWDLDSPSVGDSAHHSALIAEAVSGDTENNEEAILDVFAEIDEVLTSDHTSDDDEYDTDEDSCYGNDFTNDFSSLRENMATLSDYNETAVIPPELISGFIVSLRNIDIQDTLNEGPKTATKYSLDKLSAMGNKEIHSNNPALGLKKKKRRNQLQYRNLLRPHSFSKGRLISNFSIYRKKLDRIGTQRGDTLSMYSLSVFDTPFSQDILLNKTNKDGNGWRFLRNNPVYRRSDELQLRTFGPDIQLNSVVWGYGKLDKSLDSNLNSEEDFGLYNGLGYPEIVEQNIYDETDWVEMAYGGSVFSSKFTDFIWKVDESTGEESEQEIMANKRRIDELLWGDSDSDNSGNRSSKIYKILYAISNIPKFNDYKNTYKHPAGYNRFFSTNNQVLNDINYGSIKLTTDDYWAEHLEREDDPDLKKLITEKLVKDSFGTNIGPLGYEEGESVYDNRLLSRGWFPEKIIWDFSDRSVSGVGSDPATLELISNYKISFSHDMENYGVDPERGALKNINLENSKTLNLIDDLIEGSGIEEDIPYSPAHSEKLWHYFEYESRPNSSKLEERANNWLAMDKVTEFEEEEHEAFGPDSDPTEAEGLEYGNFNILGLNDLISTTRVWSKLDYLGDLDHSEVPGTALAITENELYDSLRTDLTNFINEKFPTDPIAGTTLTNIPDPTTRLFGGQDTFESKTPGFAEYINIYDNSRHMDQDYIPKERAKKLDRVFQMKELDRPKDEFSFAPTSNDNIVFEPEWVVAGEGWLGLPGSTKQAITQFSVPISYINPTQDSLFQPRGSHSIKIMDENNESLVENLPYNSLSDYTTNRITRGINNDSQGFPFLKSWSSPATGYASDNPPDDWWFDDKPMTSTPFTNDRISFTDSSLTQRDLWWRSIESGYISTESSREIAYGLYYDKQDTFRDFVVSYDYKLYGRSWLNPQKNDVPLKSYSFYNDTELNNFFSSRDDDISHNSGMTNSYNNQLYGDYTYGLFVSSNTNFDDSLVFYSVRIRDFLYYMLSIAVTIFSPLYLTFYSVTNSILDQIYNIVHFRSIFYIFSIKNTTQLVLFQPNGSMFILFHIIVQYLLDLCYYFYTFLCYLTYLLSVLDSLIQTLSVLDEYTKIFNIHFSSLIKYSESTDIINNQFILYQVIRILILYLIFFSLFILI